MEARSVTAARRRVLLGVTVVLLLAAGWLAVRAVQVQRALTGAQAVLLRAAADPTDLAGLGVAQREASAAVLRAREAVDDPVWRLATRMPVAGRSFTVARDATLVLGHLVDGALPPLANAGAALQDRPLLSGGTVDLQLLRSVSRHVATADAAVVTAQERTATMPVRLLPRPIADARTELHQVVERLARTLGTARLALDLAPDVLGAQEQRRYFLAVHNNAEVRGTGGLVGAYAVLEVDGGRMSLDAVGTNLDFETAPGPVVDLGPEFSARYDREFARSYWSAAVLTPHWPSAAAIMAGLWRQQGGGDVDGVLGVDPVAMAGILAVTGPAEVGGRAIGADNVVDFVMRDEYAEFPDDSPERKQVLGQLAAGLYGQVATGGYGAPQMLRAVAEAAASGHLQLWLARPEEQQALAAHRVSGSLPGGPGAYLQVVSNNAAGNKADYYVRRKVSYVRTQRGRAEVTVELTNTVDAGAVPPIVVGRLDEPTYEVEPGQTRQLLSVYVGVGERVQRVLVDGVEAAADIGTEQGHGVATVLVELPVSRPTVVVAEVTDPGGRLTYRQQPLAVDDELDVGVPYAVG